MNALMIPLPANPGENAASGRSTVPYIRTHSSKKKKICTASPTIHIQLIYTLTYAWPQTSLCWLPLLSASAFSSH